LSRLSELAQEVSDELADEKYITLSHYNRNTYAKGCRGPLCRKSERDLRRKQAAERNPSRKKYYKEPEAIARDAYLDLVIATLKSNREAEAEAG
jgi:hypothetical protein